MDEVDEIDILAVIEGQRIGLWQITLGLLVFAAMMADGYDALNMGFAASSIVREWHIQRSVLGPIFGAGLGGLMLGAAIFGPMGDRFGRKRMIVISAILLGLVNLATMLATTPAQLFWFRIAAGMGIGGVLPNVIALVSEYSPRRFQATAVWVVMMGYAGGAACGALVSTLLVPRFGWQAMFLVGGVVPLAVAALQIPLLPESVRFLALNPRHRARAVATLARMAPSLRIGPATRLVAVEERGRGMALRQLFSRELAPMTVLLWLAFICNLMTLHFLVNWTPTVLQSSAITQGQAAIATALIQIGGIIGGLIVAWLLDRVGVGATAILFLLGVPAVAFLGYGQTSAGLAMLLTFSAGFCVVGGQTVLNALAGRIYPTFMRSNGVGWANAIGRFGSVTGPVIGGVLISFNLPTTNLFEFAAIPVLCAALACFAMARLQARAR